MSNSYASFYLIKPYQLPPFYGTFIVYQVHERRGIMLLGPRKLTVLYISI